MCLLHGETDIVIVLACMRNLATGNKIETVTVERGSATVTARINGVLIRECQAKSISLRYAKLHLLAVISVHAVTSRRYFILQSTTSLRSCSKKAVILVFEPKFHHSNHSLQHHMSAVVLWAKAIGSANMRLNGDLARLFTMLCL